MVAKKMTKKQLARERARLAMANDKANVEAVKAKKFNGNGGGGRRVVTKKTQKAAKAVSSVTTMAKKTTKLSKKDARERDALAMAGDKANVEAVLGKTNVDVVVVVPPPKIEQAVYTSTVPAAKKVKKQPADWFSVLSSLLEMFLFVMDLVVVLVFWACFMLLVICYASFRPTSDLALVKVLVLSLLFCSIFLARALLWSMVKAPAKKFVVAAFKCCRWIVITVLSAIVFAFVCIGLMVGFVLLFY